MDVDIFEDAKLCVIRKEFGGKGELAAIKLLCAVYHSGYFIEWNESVRVKLYTELDGVSLGLLDQIVKSLVKWDFFDQSLFDSVHILTSHGIQKRYFAITRRRVKDPSQVPYLLPDVLTRGQPEYELLQAETLLVLSESTRKESKDNNSQSSSLFPVSSPTTTACVRPEEQRKGEKRGKVESGVPPAKAMPVAIDTSLQTFEVPMTAAEAVELLKDDRHWLLTMQKKLGVEKKTLVRMLDDFVTDCGCRQKELHENMADVKQHFNNWLAKQPKQRKGASKKKNGQKASPVQGEVSEADQRQFRKMWVRCQAELCQEVSDQEANRSFALMSFESFDPKTRVLIVQVPSQEVYEYLERNHIRLLGSVLSRYFEHVVLKYRIMNLPKRADGGAG